MPKIGNDHMRDLIAQNEEVSSYLFGKFGTQFEEEPQQGPAMTSGIISLDLRTRGLPSGITEIYGEAGVGKTAVVGQMIGNAQRNDAVCCLITDTLDKPYLHRLSVDLDALLNPRTENFGEIMLDFLKENDPALLVIDPVTAIFSPEEMLGFFRRVRMSPRSSLIVTSHARTKISADPRRTFGKGTDSASRRVTDMFSARYQLTRGKEIGDKEYQLIVDIQANTLSPPGIYVELPMVKGWGVDLERDFLNAALDMEVVTQEGPRFYLRGRDPSGIKDNVFLGQGTATAALSLAHNENLRLRVLAEMMRKWDA